MERRRKTWGTGGSAEEPALDLIRLWQREVHDPGIYDLEVDTSVLSPDACAQEIQRWLEGGMRPSAFERLVGMNQVEAAMSNPITKEIC